METMEHNENVKECDCPGCYLNAKYEAEYAAYEKLPPYITSAIPKFDGETDRVTSAVKVQKWLNERQAEGYELTAAHEGIIIMRSIPPQGITQRDVIMEVVRRKKLNEAEFPDTIGPVQ
jgi:hypothetical protein